MYLERDQPDGRIPLLAVASASPTLEDSGAPFTARWEWMLREDLLAYGIDLRRMQSVVGHGRFHVGLHRRSLGWIGGGGHLGTQTR
jgi:hypothetical protein